MTRSRRQIVTLAAVVLAASVAAACSSSPQNSFYTLAPVAPQAPAAAVTGLRPAVVAVGPVSLPDYLDRPQLVTRSRPSTLSLAPLNQWAGPLADMLPRVLVENLAQRLPGDRVVAFPQTSGPSFDYRIAVGINQFDVDPAGAATLLASWQIYPAQSAQARVVDDDVFRRPAAGSGTEGAVAAMSGALADLSQRLADSLSTVRAAAPRPIAAK
jgi:uncharacterized lipoprotein YmbA